MMDRAASEADLFAWRPPHAYLPGRTPRHPRDLFDPIRATVTEAMPDPGGSPAWRIGLDLLREGFFWEAHEVLEPVWMACPPNSAEKLLAQAVIQFANAALKRVMDRPAAAQRLLRLADDLTEEAFGRGGALILGLGRADLAGVRAVVSIESDGKNMHHNA